MSKSRMGATNKRKGSDAERFYAKVFRDLGYSFCKTSREGSKLHDNAKIDLIFIPFNIQIKAGKQKSMNPGKELLSLKSAIQVMFPPEHEVHRNPLFLVHYQEVGRGKKRLPENERVYMSLEQFESYKKENPELVYDGIKEFKFEMNSEFKVIINMTFEYFKDEIILKLCNGSSSNTTN